MITKHALFVSFVGLMFFIFVCFTATLYHLRANEIHDSLERLETSAKDIKELITQPEFQSTYVRTVDGFDIIHICGTHVFTESGEFDICFPARNQALAYAEELSAYFVNQFEE